jgi:hypothetical protein
MRYKALIFVEDDQELHSVYDTDLEDLKEIAELLAIRKTRQAKGKTITIEYYREDVTLTYISSTSQAIV